MELVEELILVAVVFSTILNFDDLCSSICYFALVYLGLIYSALLRQKCGPWEGGLLALCIYASLLHPRALMHCIFIFINFLLWPICCLEACCLIHTKFCTLSVFFLLLISSLSSLCSGSRYCMIFLPLKIYFRVQNVLHLAWKECIVCPRYLQSTDTS